MIWVLLIVLYLFVGAAAVGVLYRFADHFFGSVACDDELMPLWGVGTVLWPLAVLGALLLAIFMLCSGQRPKKG